MSRVRVLSVGVTSILAAGCLALPFTGPASAATGQSSLLSALSGVPGLLPASATVPVTSDADSAVQAASGELQVDAPRDPAQGVNLTGDAGLTVTIVPPGSQGAADATAVAPGVAGYTSSGAQTDTAVQALPDGARLLTVMYGPSAPTRFDFPLQLNPGAQLEQDDAGYKILDSGGQTVAVVDAPWAVAAYAQQVPAHYELAGTTVTLVVDHSAAAYPVVADPTIRSAGQTTDKGGSNPLSAGAGGGSAVSDGCGKAVHQARNTGCMNGSVDSSTGEFEQTATDLTRPSRGPSFAMGRTYRSDRTTAGPLGVGWTFSYGASLAIDGAGNVTLDGEDGLPVVYTKTSTGFSAPATARSELVKNAADGSYDLTRHDMVAYHFGSGGALLTLSDRNSNTLTVHHSTVGGPVDYVRDQQGHQANFSYTNSRLTSVTMAGADTRTVGYGYTNGLLTSVTDPTGKITRYGYTNSKITTVTDPRGHIRVTNTYSSGDVTRQTDALSNDTTFAAFVSAGTTPQTAGTVMTDPKGGSWTDTYTGGNLTSRQDAAGKTTSYTYTARGNSKRTTRPGGGTTDYTQDAGDNQTGVTSDAGTTGESSTASTYNGSNDPLTSTDGAGNQTKDTYGDGKNLTRRDTADSTFALYGRDSAGSGLLMSTTSEDNKQTALTYGSSANGLDGELASTTQPLGDKNTQHHDSAGRVDSAVEPRGNAAGAIPGDYQSSSTFDNNGRTTSRTSPGPVLGGPAITTSTTYDENGNRQTKTDGRGNVTRYTYDNADHLASVSVDGQGIDPASMTTYGYDTAGNLTTRTAQNTVAGLARPEVTTYGYNTSHQLTSVTNPLGGRFTYKYDNDGNRNYVRDANGNASDTTGAGITLTVYDTRSRVSTIDYADTGAGVDITYTYTKTGKRKTMVDSSGTATSNYEPLTDRLQSIVRPSGTTSYTYNNAGQVTLRVYPDQTRQAYTYNDNGQMASVLANGVTTTYAYLKGGFLQTTTLPGSNGYAEDRTYEPSGRLATVRNHQGAVNLSRAAYTYDGNGNPTQVDSEDGTVFYNYDNRNQLLRACYKATNTCDTDGATTDNYIKYAYDQVGNRVRIDRPANGTNVFSTFTYNTADQLTRRDSPNSTCNSTYDNNGNLVTQCGLQYTYNDADQTTEVFKTDAQPSGTRLFQTYTYDGDGNRLTSGGATNVLTRYQWDTNNELPQLQRESNADGTLQRRYVRGLDTVSMTTNSGDFYYHHDGLGSVTNVTSSTGAPMTDYAYEPFGDLTKNQNASSAPTNNLRFTGEYHDDFTDTYNLRARQYDASTGRFSQTDPAADRVGDTYVSAYAYTANDPTARTDPSGAEYIVPIAKVTATYYGGVVFLEGFTDEVAAALGLSGTLLTILTTLNNIAQPLGQQLLLCGLEAAVFCYAHFVTFTVSAFGVTVDTGVPTGGLYFIADIFS